MRLLVDVMCGRLVPYLRCCGHDTVYALDRDAEDDDVALEIAMDEDRAMITRDVELATKTPDAICLASHNVGDQLRELAGAGVSLELADEPERCGRCNGPLERVEPGARTPGYAPDAIETRTWRCVECGQHFWRGSHWDQMADTLATARAAALEDRRGDDTPPNGKTE